MIAPDFRRVNGTLVGSLWPLASQDRFLDGEILSCRVDLYDVRPIGRAGESVKMTTARSVRLLPPDVLWQAHRGERFAGWGQRHGQMESLDREHAFVAGVGGSRSQPCEGIPCAACGGCRWGDAGDVMKVTFSASTAMAARGKSPGINNTLVNGGRPGARAPLFSVLTYLR